jgi:toxin YoeB
MVRRVHELLKDIRRNPHSGIGKPEPLRHALSGWWSRRIDQEHRLVYRVTERGIELAQLRNHY